MTITATADTWLEQGSTSNKGDDSALTVQSKPGQAFRALVRFPLPATPAGCALDSAELRLYADGTTAGRTIEAVRTASAWSEMGVTWDSQPATIGPAAVTPSSADKGWYAWAVGAQIAAMSLDGGHGFVIRDASESDDAKQVFFSREKGENPPTLIVRYRAG